MVSRGMAVIPFLLFGLLTSSSSWGTRKELLPILLLGSYLLFRAMERLVPDAPPPLYLALGSCLLGFVWGAPTRPPTIPLFAGAFVTIEGELSSFYTFPSAGKKGLNKRNWKLTDCFVVGHETPIKKVSATIRGDERLEVGDQVRLFGWLEHGKSRWKLTARFLSHRIENELSPRRIGAQWRRRLRARIDARYSGFPARAIQSLVLGRKEIRPKDAETIRKAGVSHLFAVSGLHLVLICGVLGLMLKVIGFRDPWLGILMLIAAASFALLTGFKPPMTRALLGFALYTLASMTRRPVHSGWCLLIVATLELIRAPELAQSISFQLSFAAVAGILWLGPRPHKRTTTSALKAFLIRKKKAGHGQKLADGVILTSAAIVATAPFTLFHFGTFTPIALISNLALLPLVTATLLCGLLDVFVSLPTFILNWLCETMLISMEGASRVSFGHIESQTPPVWANLPFAVIVVLAWRLRKRSQLKSQLTAWLGVLLLLSSTLMVETKPQLRLMRNPERFDIALDQRIPPLRAKDMWEPSLGHIVVAQDATTTFHIEVNQSQGFLARGLWLGATFIDFGTMSYASCLTYCRWRKYKVDIVILPQAGADVESTVLLTRHFEPRIVVCRPNHVESFMAAQKAGCQVMDHRTFNAQGPASTRKP